MKGIAETLGVAAGERARICGAPEGFDALFLGRLAREEKILWILRREARLGAARAALRRFAPDVPVIEMPAPDCLPYDRLSPSPGKAAARAAGLTALAKKEGACMILTTINAALQRVPPAAEMRRRVFEIKRGAALDAKSLKRFFSENGFRRAEVVSLPGDYAFRGGLVDIYPPGWEEGARIDLFGDVVEDIRLFNPATQRSVGSCGRMLLTAASEISLSSEAISRFRSSYGAFFGASGRDESLYAAVSAGQTFEGMEHSLPFFWDAPETLFDYAPEALVVLDHGVEENRRARLRAIEEGKQVQKERAASPNALYLNEAEWAAALSNCRAAALSPFASDEGIDAGGRPGRNFAAERAAPDADLFEALETHIADLEARGRRVVVAAWSEGARQRLARLISGRNGRQTACPPEGSSGDSLPPHTVACVVLGLDAGFEAEDFAVVSESDVFGERLVPRGSRGRRRAEAALLEARALSEGDLVVHADHGIGRFEGLKRIEALGAAHDCLSIAYAEGGRLLVPVENADLVTRYGSGLPHGLDRLGASAWQARKARAKKRVAGMARRLISVAAARGKARADRIEPPEGLYEEFCARFPFEETEDQSRTMKAVLKDLASGVPMDRLVCGDVGFGKTEIAMRAAFAAAMSGKQTAVVVPTTLLCRQHFETFGARFKGLPFRIGRLSRLVGRREASAFRAGLEDGSLDVAIGTHALLGKGTTIRNLGLLVIDEEQHFGVAHKERLKEMKKNVHVLTLTATPIPRSLQLALSGAREMSLIAEAPEGRLPVRSFVAPFESQAVRGALMREKARGGQSFFICPRVRDLRWAEDFLRSHAGDLSFVTAHGKMRASLLEERMSAFYEGRADVLLATHIVESGLDVPRANTLIVHKAHMFGLAQLHQLRGRTGRGKVRAYAYFTIPQEGFMRGQAEKRLRSLQLHASLGAGFSLAAEDLDMRGAGNLLGEEQSGHIREVGYELYQKMLREAVAGDAQAEAAPAPRVSLNVSMLIGESYVPDIDLRLDLYRRLARIEGEAGVEGFAAEMLDRFGPLPEETARLLEAVRLKGLCREAGVESLEAGGHGVVLGFYANSVVNPAGLARFIEEEGERARFRPDHRLVLKRDWQGWEDKLNDLRALLERLKNWGAGEKEAKK